MAQLKDLLVTGAARFLNEAYGDLNGNVLNYGECTTSAGTNAKAVDTLTGTFELKKGSEVAINFLSGNTASNLTLNVNKLGAKDIYIGDSAAPAAAIQKGTYLFRYDGTHWQLIGSSIATRIGTAEIGDVDIPVYIKSGGIPTAISHYIRSNVATGAKNRLAYYSATDTISNTSNIEVLNATKNSHNAELNGLHIWGTTYGDSATDLTSTASGIIRYGDGGPQIQFSNSNNSNAEAGALIFTKDDEAGRGTSFHFVSNQSDDDNGGNLTVTAPRFRARKGLTVGQNTDDDGYTLYVNGDQGITGTIYPTNSNQFYLGGSSNYWNGAYINGNGNIHWNNLVKLNNTTVVSTEVNRGLPRVLSNFSDNIALPGNKLFGLSKESITIEYTTDNWAASTAWSNSNANTDATSRRALVNGVWDSTATVAKVGNLENATTGSSCSPSVGYGTRVILDFQKEDRKGYIECLVIGFYTRGHTAEAVVERWNKNRNTWTEIYRESLEDFNGQKVIYPATTFYINGNTSDPMISSCNMLRISLTITSLGTFNQFAPAIDGIVGFGQEGVSQTRNGAYLLGKKSDLAIAQFGLPFSFVDRKSVDNSIQAFGQYWQFYGDGSVFNTNKANFADIWIGNEDKRSTASDTANHHAEGRLRIYDEENLYTVIKNTPYVNKVNNVNSASYEFLIPRLFTNGTIIPHYVSTSTFDMDNIYDIGLYSNTSGSLNGAPIESVRRGSWINIPYTKASGNTTPNFVSQIYIHGYESGANQMFYRTSTSASWHNWQSVVHVRANTQIGTNTQPVYISTAGQAIASTYVQNRLYYSASTSSFEPTEHYASSSKVAINSTSEPDYNLYVNGTGHFNGQVSISTAVNTTSTATGALTVSGGVGIGKDIFIGGDLRTQGAQIQKITLLPQTTGGFDEGWKRICLVKSLYSYGNFQMLFTGGWHTSPPTMANISFTLRNKIAAIKVLHQGFTGNIKKIRLVHNDDASNTYWLDAYIGALASTETLGAQYATFIGNVIISNLNTTLITAPSSTAVAEIDLTTGVNVTTYNGTANRIAWYKTTTTLNSGSIATNGEYLSNISYLSVNHDHQTGYRAYINGTSYLGGNVTLEGNSSFSREGKSINWNEANTYAMLRMTSENGWSPFWALKTDNGWWTMGHYSYNNYTDQLLFGFLADVDVAGVTNAKNHLDYTVRLLPTVYETNTTTTTDRAFVTSPYASNSAAVGSNTHPVFVNAQGVVSTLTHSLNATLNSGTAGRFAYYSANTTVANTPNVQYRSYNTSTSSTRTAAGQIRGILITGQTYGNDAAYLNSTTAGDFSLNDPGPQIQFGISEGAPKAALIYTNHDSNGLAGSHLDFVTDEAPGYIVSHGFVARQRVTIGQRSANTSYPLYVHGNIYSEGSVPNLIIKNTDTAANTYSIIRLRNINNKDALIFLNGPSRTNDGGANMLTIRNDAGDLRLDNNVHVTGHQYNDNWITKERGQYDILGMRYVSTGGYTNTSTGTTRHTSIKGDPWAEQYYFAPRQVKTYASTAANAAVTNTAYTYGYFEWREFSHSSSTGARLSYLEGYKLPTVSADLTAHKWYTIITTKNPDLLYWANVKISTASNAATEPTFGRVFVKHATAPRVYAYINNATMNTAPSSNLYGCYEITDKNGRRFGQFEGAILTDKSHIMNMYVANHASSVGYAGLQIRYDASDNFSAAINAPFKINSIGNARSTLTINTITNNPNDLWFGIGDTHRWSFSARPSGENYSIGLWAANATAGWAQMWYQDKHSLFYGYVELQGANNIRRAGSSVSWIKGRDSALVRLTSFSGYTAIWSAKTKNGDWCCGPYNDNILYWSYGTDANYNSNTNTVVQMRLTPAGYLYSARIYTAVWNDYAEYRESKETKPGTCVQENDNGKLTLTNKRLIPGASIVSDTYGYAQGETEKAKTPIATSGRVLAYTYQDRKNYHAGMSVCSAPNGTIDIMTREEIQQYPDAIIGIVSEIPDYEFWGDNKQIPVNNRIWIKVRY